MSSISWSRDGKKILTAASDMNVAIHDVLSAECEHKQVHHTFPYGTATPHNKTQLAIIGFNFCVCNVLYSFGKLATR